MPLLPPPSDHKYYASLPPRRKNPNASVVGCHMTKRLYEMVHSHAPNHQKHIFFEAIVQQYLLAFERYEVARAYIGVNRMDDIQTTFYMTNPTIAACRQIANDDGVAVGAVIRTAVAWYLFKDAKARDTYGTDRYMPPRGHFSFGDDVSSGEDATAEPDAIS